MDIGKEEIIKGIDNYTLKSGYRLYDFKFTNDVNNVIVSYLADNEIESTTGSKVNNGAIHTVVFNRDNKIIFSGGIAVSKHHVRKVIAGD